MWRVKMEQQSPTGSEFIQLSQLGELGYPQAQKWIENKKATLRPWSLFFNRVNIKLSPSPSRLTKRIVKNIEYFQSNYFFVFIGLFIYCLITSPLLLITVAAALGACYKTSQINAAQGLSICNVRITLVQAYCLIGIISLPMLYLVNAGAAVFWVLGVSCFLITLHASFYNIDSVLCPGEDELNSLIMEEV